MLCEKKVMHFCVGDLAVNSPGAGHEGNDGEQKLLGAGVHGDGALCTSFLDTVR